MENTLAYREKIKYNIPAALVLEKTLPSFEVRIKDGELIIAAPDEIELLYGVYSCAENFYGWDFFEPGRDVFHPHLCKNLPEKDHILIPAVKKKLLHCGFIQEYAFNESTFAVFDWMAKNKLNYLMVWMSCYDTLTEDMKRFAKERGIIIESGHHNFDYLIPREKYKNHPEFFAVRQQDRINENLVGMPEESRQLCTTNPALREELFKNILQWHKEHPETDYIGLNPNDGFGWCECENCSRLYDKNRKGATYCRSEKYYCANTIFHDLISYVSKALHKVKPEIVLNFFAYINYSRPAANFKLLPGTSVHLALYWRCINHLITDQSCAINTGYLRDILEWEKAKAGGLFNIYEYYQGINFYLGLPMLHFEEMFQEIDFYSRHKVDGVFTQFSNENWSAYGINYFLMARASRGEDYHESMRSFYEKRFGKMAEKAEIFYGKLKKLLKKLGDCHIPHSISFISRVKKEELIQLQKEAELLSRSCELLPGKSFSCWMEYMICFRELYEKSMDKTLTEKDVKDFLLRIQTNKEYSLFVQDKFARFFGTWLEDVSRKKVWRYFTEHDWEKEYERHSFIN